VESVLKKGKEIGDKLINVNNVQSINKVLIGIRIIQKKSEILLLE